MDHTQWECLDFFSERYDTLVESSLISLQPYSVKIFRNKEHHLMLELTYRNVGLVELSIKPRMGVYLNTEHAVFSSHLMQNSIKCTGLNLIRTVAKNIDMEYSLTVQTWSIDNIETIDNTANSKDKYYFEWFLNLKIIHATWPGTINRSQKTNSDISFSAKTHSTNLQTSSFNQQTASECCHFVLDEVNFYFGQTKTGIETLDSKNPGFIFYDKKTDRVQINKVIDALSFLMGNNLIHFGSSVLSENCYVSNFTYKTPNTANGSYLNLQSQPPARYNNGHLIDIGLITKFVKSFADNYETYDLKHVFWLYWHAAASPIHLQAVCFVAVIEFIQNKYIGVNESKFSKTIIPKARWRKLLAQLRRNLKENDEITAGEIEIFERKLTSFNLLPHSMIAESFFKELDLDFGEFEKLAYQRRNDAAHGNKVPNDDFVSLIQETKVLRIICNRIILRVLGVTDNYIDYYDSELPTRTLKQAIPFNQYIS